MKSKFDEAPPITDEDLYGEPTVLEFDEVIEIKEEGAPPVDSEDNYA